MQKRLMALAWLSVCALVMVACTEQAREQPTPAVSAQYTNGSGGCEHLQFQSKDYLFCEDKVTWQEASANCQSVGLQLAQIDDAPENDFIDDNINDPSWTAATDQQVEGEWVWLPFGEQFWTGDESGSAVGGLYTNWSSGEPDGDSQSCGKIRSLGGKWRDAVCTDTEAYVCEGTALGNVSPPADKCSLRQYLGRAYWFCRLDLDWTVARDNCTAVGAELATITSAAENDFVHDFLGERSFIGANDRAVEGTWTWDANGTVFWQGDSGGAPVAGAYSNWNNGEPDNPNDDCAMIRKIGIGNWKVHKCTNPEAYVCRTGVPTGSPGSLPPTPDGGPVDGGGTGLTDAGVYSDAGLDAQFPSAAGDAGPPPFVDAAGFPPIDNTVDGGDSENNLEVQ